VKKLDSASNTPSLTNHSTNQIPVLHAPMAKNNNFLPVLIHRQRCVNTKRLSYKMIGVFLYYAWAVDCTMLTALGSLATQQANPTESTLAQIHQFLDYALSHPNAGITYCASDMILAAHSDTSYLSETNACSRASGHFFLSKNDHFPNNNGAVLTIAQIIKAVMSSTAEAELGALYINA
jgi:hypothetical protein